MAFFRGELRSTESGPLYRVSAVLCAAPRITQVRPRSRFGGSVQERQLLPPLPQTLMRPQSFSYPRRPIARAGITGGDRLYNVPASGASPPSGSFLSASRSCASAIPQARSCPGKGCLAGPGSRQCIIPRLRIVIDRIYRGKRPKGFPTRLFRQQQPDEHPSILQSLSASHQTGTRDHPDLPQPGPPLF